MNYVLPLQKLLLCSLILLALAACTTKAPQINTSNPNDPNFIASIKIDTSTQKADLEALYGGEVLLFEPNDGFAILGFSDQEAQLTTLGTERNLKTFGVAESQAPGIDYGPRTGKLLSTQGTSVWSGGTSAWSGGTSAWSGGTSAWSGGTSAWSGGTSAWSGGWTNWDGYAPSWEGDTQTFTPLDNGRAWQQIGLYEAQTQLATNLGNNVIVAVIDTGIDLSHPVFNNRLVPGYDFVDNDSVPQETLGTNYGHGTAVAGIILQVAPLAKIMPLRALDGDGQGDTDDVALAINYAIDNGAKVINLSLGSLEPVEPIQVVLRKAQEHKVLVVSSAGNTGDEKVTFPAAEAKSNTDFADVLVSVASVSWKDYKSEFSTYNSQAIEIAAPGEFVFTAQPDNQVSYWNGTSFAAPMVTGAIALALGQPNLDVIPYVLSKSAVDYSAASIYQLGDNSQYLDTIGQGRLDIKEFLQNVLDPNTGTLMIKSTINNDNGGTKVAADFSFSVNGGPSMVFDANGVNQLTLTERTYSVTTLADAGYNATYSNCTNVVITAGNTATCTITNDDIAPQLKVTYLSLPATDAGRFNLSIDGEIKKASAANNGTTGFIKVFTGTHTISQTAAIGNLANYITTYGGDCTANGSVTLAVGEAKECTISNTRKARLTITNLTQGGDSAFRLSSSFTALPFKLTTVAGTASRIFSVVPGNHTIAEIIPAGWNLMGASCSDGSALNSLELSAGENLTCTFTNVKKATLTIQVIRQGGADRAFGFKSSFGNFNATTVDAKGSRTFSVAASVVAGSHTIAQTIPTGWTLANAQCDDGTSTPITGLDKHIENIVLAPGAVVTCTFTNIAP